MKQINYELLPITLKKQIIQTNNNNSLNQNDIPQKQFIKQKKIKKQQVNIFSTQNLASSQKQPANLKINQDQNIHQNIKNEIKKQLTPRNQNEIGYFEYIENIAQKITKSDVFSYFYLILLFIYLIVNSLETIKKNSKIQERCEYIDFAFQIIFSLTIILKLIIFKNQDLIWLILDVVSNIFGYLSFSIKDQEALRYLKAIKVLRNFLIIRYCVYLNLPATNMINSLKSVGKILIPAVMFVYFYAVIGLFTFHDYQYTKCRDPNNKLLTNNWTVYTDSIFLCGQKSCPVVNGIQYECLNPVDYGVQPNQKQVINIMQGNGLMRYNNIWFALFSTLKQFFVTGSSRLMLFGKQVLSQYFVLTYYLSYTYLLAYIYANIFYGLMMSNTKHAQQEKQAVVLQLSLMQSKKSQNNNIHQQKLKRSQIDYYSRRQCDQSLEQLNPNLSQGDQAGKRKISLQENSLVQINNRNFIIDKRVSQIQSQKQSIKQKQINQQNFKITQSKTIDNKIVHNQNQQIIAANCNLNNIKNEIQVKHNYSKIENKIIKINKFGKDQTLENTNKEIQQQKLQKLIKVESIIKKKNNQKILFNELEQFQIRSNNQVKQQTFQDRQNQRKYNQIMKKYYIFQHFSILLCAINICIQYENQPDNIRLLTDVLDFCFFCTYFLQMIFRYIVHRKLMSNKSIQYGFKLDLIIFIFCFAGMIYQAVVSRTILQFIFASDQASLLLRTMKYLRILVLLTATPYLKEVRIIFNATFQSIYQTRFMAALWFLIALIFSLNGFHLFQGQTKADQNGNFDPINGTEFPVSFQGLSNSLIFTLFAFQNQEWDWFVFQQYLGSGWLVVIWQYVSLFVGLQICSKYYMSILMNEIGNRLNAAGATHIQHSLVTSIHQSQYFNDQVFRKSIVAPLQLNEFAQDKLQKQNKKIKASQKTIAHKRKTQQLKQKIIQQNLSFCQLFRKYLSLILKSQKYLYFRIFMIIISLALVFLMSPLTDPASLQMIVYERIWWVTIAFFGLQIIFSIFTFGFLHEKHGYLTKFINWIYLIVFIIEILNCIPKVHQIYFFNNIMCLRIFRIFVFVQIRYYFNINMRITIISFWKLLPKIIILWVGTLILEGFFAIILVKLYKNDFYYCVNDSSPVFINTMQDCINWGGDWIQRKMNVSNYIQSLIYLNLLGTTQGWSAQVVEAASIRGQGMNAKVDSTEYLYFYLSIFFFFANLIMLNIFLGISINNFKQIQQQITGYSKLTQDDKMWLSIKNQIYRLKPKIKSTIPENFIRENLYKFLRSNNYKILNGILFIGFMICMSFFQTNMSENKKNILQGFFNGFVATFLFFYFITFVAYGPSRIQKRFVKFQTIAVLYIIIYYIISSTVELDPRQLRIMRSVVLCLLAIRYFALLTEFQFIHKLINSLITVLPQTLNVWMLIAIVLLIYAAIGIQIFGYLRIYPELNEFDQNFVSLNKAIFALIKFSILQSPIFQVIDGATLNSPDAICFDINNYAQFAKYGRMGCGNKFKSYIFYISFLVIFTQVLMSTLMAIIFNAYSQVRIQQESMVNKFQLQQVQKAWSQFDLEAKGYISYYNFWKFISTVLKIYHVNIKQLHETKHSFLKLMHIPIYQDQDGVLSFQFHQVVQGITRIVLRQKKGKDWDTTQADKLFRTRTENASLKKMKKSFYDSTNVQALITLKFGLANWKNKTCSQKRRSAFKAFTLNTFKTLNQKLRSHSLIPSSTSILAKTQLKINKNDNISNKQRLIKKKSNDQVIYPEQFTKKYNKSSNKDKTQNILKTIHHFQDQKQDQVQEKKQTNNDNNKNLLYINNAGRRLSLDDEVNIKQKQIIQNQKQIQNRDLQKNLFFIQQKPYSSHQTIQKNKNARTQSKIQYKIQQQQQLDNLQFIQPKINIHFMNNIIEEKYEDQINRKDQNQYDKKKYY